MAEVTLLGAVVLFWEGTDGNNLSYGLTDGTMPLAGVAKIDYAEVE